MGVQRLWQPIGVTAGKLPVSLVPQCETMSDGPSCRTWNRGPIFPQILFVRNVDIEEEEWKCIEFGHCSLDNQLNEGLSRYKSRLTTVFFPSFPQRSSIGSLVPYLERSNRL
jgi:hypothetical protein